MYKTWLKTYHICLEKQPTFKINIYKKKKTVFLISKKFPK